MSLPTELFTVGVEEEYQIIDPQTRELCPRSLHLLPIAQDDIDGAAVQLEFRQSQIEVATPVCYSLTEVQEQLTDVRHRLSAAAAQVGCQLAAAGTHPFAHWQDQPLTPDDCYHNLAQRYQRLMHELVTFGCHVHVGIGDRDLAMQVMNRARRWLAPLLALSASSPFWLGGDTHYDSYRTVLIRRLPMTGAPPEFANYREYQAVVQSFVQAQIIDQATQVCWDVRPSERFCTLEFRLPDMTTTVDETVMLAGLVRGLVRTCYDQARSPLSRPVLRPEMLYAAQWSAARWGLSAHLIDAETQQPLPASQAVEQLLEFVHPALEDFGEWETVTAIAHRTLHHGNSATRQRQVFHQRESLIDVVDALVAETCPDSRPTAPAIPTGAAQLYKS